MELVEGIENQINQVFENINQILKADGMDFSNVVKLSVLLEDLSHFEKVNEIMANIFSKPYPARAAYEVSKLPKGSLVEIETIAFKE
jgi:reactive intermediate/imine deaminase